MHSQTEGWSDRHTRTLAYTANTTWIRQNPHTRWAAAAEESERSERISSRNPLDALRTKSGGRKTEEAFQPRQPSTPRLLIHHFWRRKIDSQDARQEASDAVVSTAAAPALKSSNKGPDLTHRVCSGRERGSVTAAAAAAEGMLVLSWK